MKRQNNPLALAGGSQIKMEIKVKEIEVLGNSTLSGVYVDGVFRCFCIEDVPRAIKVFGETRIPRLRYKVVRRLWGKFYTRHKKKWNHKSALEIIGVPNFTAILLHPGLTADHSHGCPLIGTKPFIDDAGNFKFGESHNAYRKLYSEISRVIDGQEVYIDFISNL